MISMVSRGLMGIGIRSRSSLGICTRVVLARVACMPVEDEARLSA